MLWRQADIYVSAMAGVEGATAESIGAEAEAGAMGPWYAVPPLMHAAAQWTAYSGLHRGCTVLVHDDSRPFDPGVVLALIQRERAFMMSIVGDAYLRPLVDELRTGQYDVSSLVMIGTGGAATSDHLKEALLDLVPDLTIVDGYGASETGGMAFGARTRSAQPEGFSPGPGATVVSADRTRVLEPGEEEVGWTARRGRVPLGYLGDPEGTEATFPIIDGERVAIPGDRAQCLADGSIRMLGRDSMVVNTGGEKVYVEEVEAVLLDPSGCHRCPRRRPALRSLRPGGGRRRGAPQRGRAGPRRAPGVRGRRDRPVQGPPGDRRVRRRAAPRQRQGRLPLGP